MFVLLARRVEVRPQFTKTPSDIRLNEGDTLTIEAEVDGIPTPEIVWSLDGEELSGIESSYRGKVARYFLMFVEFFSIVYSSFFEFIKSICFVVICICREVIASILVNCCFFHDAVVIRTIFFTNVY